MRSANHGSVSQYRGHREIDTHDNRQLSKIRPLRIVVYLFRTHNYLTQLTGKIRAI